MSEYSLIPGAQVYIEKYSHYGVGVVRAVFTSKINNGLEKCLVNFPSSYWEHWFLAGDLVSLTGACAACNEQHIDWHILVLSAGRLSFYYTCPQCAFTSPGKPTDAEALSAAIAVLKDSEE